MAELQSVRDLIARGIAALSIAHLGQDLLIEGSTRPPELVHALEASSAGLYFECGPFASGQPRGPHRRDLKKDLDLSAQDPSIGRTLLRGSFGSLLILVGDAVKRTRVQPQMASARPLFELLRHLRNAAAHGNRFRLDKGEPRHPAGYRTFHVKSEDNGRENVLFDFIPTGDVLDLLQAIGAHI